MFSIIVAYDEAQAIGKDNDLLWRIPEDLAFFKQTTIDHTIVMGRKTYESIGRPLPRRKTIVLTRSELSIEGVEVENFETFIDKYQNSQEEIFICGGAEIYQLFLPYAQKMYITKVSGAHDADVYFPTWDETQFDCREVIELTKDAVVYLYERKM